MSRDIARSFGGVHRTRAEVSRTTNAPTPGDHLERETPRSPRPQENQVTIGANTSLDDAAAGDYGAVPWGQTSINPDGADTLEDTFGERITPNGVVAAEKKAGQDDNDQFIPPLANVSLGPPLTGNYRRPKR